MTNRIRADGDVWRPVFSETADGGRTLVFICDSNGQRPYRVVVLNDDLKTQDDVAALSGEALRTLFDGSGSMGASQP